MCTRLKASCNPVLKSHVWIVFIGFLLAAGPGLSAQSLGGKTGIDNALQPWKDNRGKAIDAHGAGFLFDQGDYYLYGEIKQGKTWLVPGQGWECERVAAGGVSCYSSKDLVHWTYRGIALSPMAGTEIDTGSVIERPKVIYNRLTGKYVMWIHVDNKIYKYARAGVAESDRPQGPYHYLGSFRPNGFDSRDMTLFKDTDGKAWLVFSSENNTVMHVQPLSSDYLQPAPGFKRILLGLKREAPAVFRYKNKYYLITSLCSGWDPNAATWAVSDSMMGGWKQMGNPCTGPDSALTYEAQSAYVLPIEGKKDAFLFAADRWNKLNLARSSYLWLPLVIEHGRPLILWKNNWNPASVIRVNP